MARRDAPCPVDGVHARDDDRRLAVRQSDAVDLVGQDGVERHVDLAGLEDAEHGRDERDPLVEGQRDGFGSVSSDLEHCVGDRIGA